MEWDKGHDEVSPIGSKADGDGESGSVVGEGRLWQRSGFSSSPCQELIKLKFQSRSPQLQSKHPFLYTLSI